MKAVIFDVDGTLIDSVDLHAKAWQLSLEHFGYPQSFQDIRSQIGKGGDQLLPQFVAKEVLSIHGKEIEKYRSDLFKKEFIDQVRPFPEVRPLFQRLLKDGWKIAVASSAKQDELQTYKDICEISDLLDTETTSDDAEKSKPYPDIFIAAAKRLKNISVQDCVVIGDSPYDAEAAHKAGMQVMAFLCGGFSKDVLLSAGFKTFYCGPADLLENYESSSFYRNAPLRSL